MNAKAISKTAAVILSLIFMGTSVTNASVSIEKEQRAASIVKKGQSSHAEYEISVRKISNEDDLFELRVRGAGNYAQFKDVTWLSQARMFRKDGSVFINETKTEVFSAGTKVFESQKTFDHEARSVSLKMVNEKGEIISEEKYPINGPICDDVTLVHVLPFLTPDKNLKNLRYFYLLTNEPKLYHVMVKYRGEEALQLNQHVKTEKFQLMADLGPLTEVAAKLVPPTFVWYSKNSSDWYQYEGMESGYKTANIKNFVVQK